MFGGRVREQDLAVWKVCIHCAVALRGAIKGISSALGAVWACPVALEVAGAVEPGPILLLLLNQIISMHGQWL